MCLYDIEEDDKNLFQMESWFSPNEKKSGSNT
jgi:hypothetical protein